MAITYDFGPKETEFVIEADGSKHERKRLLSMFGLSTDTKPTDEQVACGSTFFETDTVTAYIWTGSIWKVI